MVPYLLEKVPESLFKDPLFPNIKKALLRSPEVAIYGVRAAISSVPNKMDDYAQEIAKGLSASLASGDEEQRNEAVAVAVALASKSSVKTVGQLTNKLFDSLAAAKTAEQRVSILNGIAGCAQADQPGAEFNKLATEVIQKTAKADKESAFSCLF